VEGFGRHIKIRQLVKALQRDLLKLSSDSRLVAAVNSGHLVQINDGALLV